MMPEERGNTASPASNKPKLPPLAYLLCGWPLLLVAVGGAIGGGLGGAAFGVNVIIYRSKLPLPAKIALNLISGLAAIGIWLAVAVAIEMYFGRGR
jgi:hypothetical protein